MLTSNSASLLYYEKRWAVVVAVNVKYIWPLQAPLADGGAQRKRLNAVRQQLGWQVIGCDYIECFQ